MRRNPRLRLDIRGNTYYLEMPTQLEKPMQILLYFRLEDSEEILDERWLALELSTNIDRIEFRR